MPMMNFFIRVVLFLLGLIVATGLLFVDAKAEDLHAHLNTVQTPFNQLGVRDLCPGKAALDRINASLR